MKRRSLVMLIACAFAAPATRAQPRLRRVGFLTLRSGPNEFDAAFREALRQLGYVEGRTLRLEYRWAAGSERRADELAAELVMRDMEVIVAATTAAIRAAMRATKTIPIVMAASADPVVAGVVGSHARPGGNVTGLSMVATDTVAKRMQLLHEMVPAAKRVGVVIFGSSAAGVGEPGNVLLSRQVAQASRQLGIVPVEANIERADDLEAAFATLVRERVDALFVQASAVTLDQRARIAQLAIRHRLPAMYETEAFAEAGGLFSYGPSLTEMYRRCASYVDRILRGARPADLPIEQPTAYRLVLNRKAAKALDFPIPAALATRADRVID